MKYLLLAALLTLANLQFSYAQDKETHYPTLLQQALALTETQIYDPALLSTDAWKEFRANLENNIDTVTTDVGLKNLFRSQLGTLPFTHYFFHKPAQERPASTGYRPTAYLERPAEGIHYLKIKSFSGSAEEMDSLMAEVITQQSKLLIIDLRNNPGGSVRAGMALARRLVTDTLYGGLFLTRKFFNQPKPSIPGPDQYASFTHFSEASYELIQAGIHKELGLCLKVYPHKVAFTGKIVFLINKNTGSTCEPLIYAMQQYGLATLVGQTSAGAMLNGEKFSIAGYELFCPQPSITLPMATASIARG